MPLSSIFFTRTASWAIITLIWGLLNLFLGYRLFRIFLGLSGAFIGAQLAARYFPNSSELVHLFLIIAAAILTSFLAYALYSFTFTLLGAITGLIIAMSLLRFFPILSPYSIIVFVLGVLLGAAFGSALKDLVIIVATAAGGASLTLQGLEFFIPTVPLVASLFSSSLSGLFWVALFILGLISQVNHRSLPA